MDLRRPLGVHPPVVTIRAKEEEEKEEETSDEEKVYLVKFSEKKTVYLVKFSSVKVKWCMSRPLGVNPPVVTFKIWTCKIWKN